MKNDVVIVGGLRTAIGTFGGALKTVRPEALTVHVMGAVMAEGGVRAEWIDKVIWGCNFSPLDQNIARYAACRTGIPETVPGFTVNSTCGSSLQAIISADQAIRCGEAEMVLAGGTECMSSAPYIVEAHRWGQRMRHSEMVDLFWKGIQEPPIGVGMGLTAENLAEKYGICREEQDAFALLSHQRAARATDLKRFEAEITPVPVPKRGGAPVLFGRDEHVRPDLTLAQLSGLKPAFKEGGTVTAGNSCGVNDGSAAVVLASTERAAQLGLTPLARIAGYHVVGVDPNFMGIGPVPAIKGLLARTGLSLNDIDRFEINEAFAAQYLACERQLGLDRDKVNPCGSGISLGHPVGATGCRLVVTLLHGMLKSDLTLGIASLCAGGGMGFALALERR